MPNVWKLTWSTTNKDPQPVPKKVEKSWPTKKRENHLTQNLLQTPSYGRLQMWRSRITIYTQTHANTGYALKVLHILEFLDTYTVYIYYLCISIYNLITSITMLSRLPFPFLSPGLTKTLSRYYTFEKSPHPGCQWQMKV